MHREYREETWSRGEGWGRAQDSKCTTVVHGCCLLRFESVEGKGEEGDSVQQKKMLWTSSARSTCQTPGTAAHAWKLREGMPGAGRSLCSGFCPAHTCLIKEVDPTGVATGRPAAHGRSLHFWGRGKPWEHSLKTGSESNLALSLHSQIHMFLCVWQLHKKQGKGNPGTG